MSSASGVPSGTPRVGWWQSFKNKLTPRREKRISQQNASASKDIKGADHVSQRKIRSSAIKATWNDFRKGNIGFGGITKKYNEYYQEYKTIFEMKSDYGTYQINQTNKALQAYMYQWKMQVMGDLNQLKKGVTSEVEQVGAREEELFKNVKTLREQYKELRARVAQLKPQNNSGVPENRAVCFDLVAHDQRDPENIPCGFEQKRVVWHGTIGEKYQAVKDANKKLAATRERLSAAYKNKDADIAAAERDYQDALKKRDGAQASFDPYKAQFEAERKEYMELIQQYGQAEMEIWSAEKQFFEAKRAKEDYPTNARWNLVSGFQHKFEEAKAMLKNSRSEAETNVIIGAMEEIVENVQSMNGKIAPECKYLEIDRFSGDPVSSSIIIASRLYEMGEQMECYLQTIRESGVDSLKQSRSQYPDLHNTLNRMGELQEEVRKMYKNGNGEACPIEIRMRLMDAYMDTYEEFTKSLCSLGHAENPQYALRELREAHNALICFCSRLAEPLDQRYSQRMVQETLSTYSLLTKDVFGEKFREIVKKYGDQYASFFKASMPFIKRSLEVELYLVAAAKSKNFDVQKCAAMLKNIEKNQQDRDFPEELIKLNEQVWKNISQSEISTVNAVNYWMSCVELTTQLRDMLKDRGGDLHLDSAAFLGELSKRTKMSPEDLIGKLAQQEEKEPKKFVESLAKEMGLDVNVFIKTLAKKSGENIDDLKTKLGFTTEPAVD